MKNKMCLCFLLVFVFLSLATTSVFAEMQLVTNDRVNFRELPSTDSHVFAVLNPNTPVVVTEIIETGWSKVVFADAVGFIKSELLSNTEDYANLLEKRKQNTAGPVELLDWSTVKNIFTIGAPAEVRDVYTGKVYYVKSFSNGQHADVEPITKEDTAILKETYGGVWDWEPRPVWVTINGRTIAGSINGMPHGGGVNPNNGMDGQVCIHFKGSTTHNGNSAFGREHQDAAVAAYNYANR